jgi:SAM-dependent methyltransferase
MAEPHPVAQMWAAGDYATLGDKFASVGGDLVTEIGVAGLDVLDVATGTGNTAIPAAAAGGRVTAADITPELLDIGRRRAAERGVAVRWIESDMHRLPVPDAAFDRVLSTFGVFVSPRPRDVAAELVRVCRPGGVIATTAWTPDSAFSQFGIVLGGFLPDDFGPGEDFADPSDWARPEKVAGFFAGLPVTVTTSVRSVRISYPPPAEAVELFSRLCGPIMGLRAALVQTGRWEAAREAMTETLTGLNQGTDGALVVDVSYLLTVVART